MKLGRLHGQAGLMPVAVDQHGQARDLSGHITDLAAAQIGPRGLARLRDIDLADLPVVTGTPAPFLADLRRIFCIGLNYHDHAAEVGLPVPDEPILFMKACDPTGAHDPIMLPKDGLKTDWEVELGVVIGTLAQHVTEQAALDHVAGYFVANDVSERAFQLAHGGQWVKGKSADSFAPVGPWMATTDEIGDVQALDLWLDVNGTRMQTGSTRTMVFSVAEIIARISRYITLRPGDVLLTGTPPGVAAGMTPPRYLQEGDVVTAGIAGLGTMRNPVVGFQPVQFSGTCNG